ncbi:ATP-binding protein [Planomonospora parontospora]|uniref:ATP-binding protein n=1 Tax=Planomonospora parontospora TaxID=58119 RepID=UPI0019503544|nr:ATP-binding protein [Planomonospora parontospora]
MRSGFGERFRRASRTGMPVVVLIALLVAVTGTALSVWVGAALREAQQRGAEQQLDRRTALVTDAVATESGRYADTLRLLAAALGSHARLTKPEFDQTTRVLEGMRLAGATSIALMVPATAEQIPRVQEFWRRRGVPDLVLNAEGRAHEHVFSVLSRSLDGSTRTATGIDASQAPESARALAEARRSGQVTVSDTYRLIRDRYLPPERRQLSIVLTAPVYGPVEGDRRPFVGWVLMGVRGQDFIGASLRRAAQGLSDVRLLARHGDGSLVPIAELRGRAPREVPRDLHRTTSVQVAQRHWQLEIAAASALLPGAHSPLPLTATAAGTALSLLLAALVSALGGGRARARAQVVAATAGLRAAEADARRQAGLLAAVLDSASDGVGVVDGQGRFLMNNPAAGEILGVPPAAGGPESWQDHYGILLPDGSAPFPTEEMPMTQALAGRRVEQVPMMIRNRAHPEGIVLSVSAQPLDPSGGRSGAVTVFRDITALREHEAELAAFAGVVAHDLRRPLTAMRGFVELVRDELDELVGELPPESSGAAGAGVSREPEVRAVAGECVRHLDQALAGIARMAGLIDDLLAYATARDATLQPREVDLDSLVREIAAEHLTAAAAEPGRPAPRIGVGPLPAVHADPPLVRQLVDNLVGNAVKYVRPGQGAEVEVRSLPAPPGRVRIEVADRGIGIPPGQHQAIFAGFHRAVGGYTGTGLGLAICERIVERHGGAITAEDNPGGGARFRFTLPAAEDEPAVEHRPGAEDGPGAGDRPGGPS